MLEKLKQYLSEEEYKLGKYLQEIKHDEEKVVTCNYFSKDEFIVYDHIKHAYTYEDGVKIGNDEIDVIYFFRGSQQVIWSKTAKWSITKKPIK